jgi:hypothetical protein
VYGTTRLGDASIAFDERVRLARDVMATGVWMHTSQQDGDALDVLRVAFDADRARASRLICKIGWENTDEVRRWAIELAARMGKQQIDIAQLCLNGDLAKDFAAGGPCLDELARIRAEGLVGRYVLQVFPWTSDVALAALAAGHADSVIDGYIFYLNPLQRFASNPLWDLLQERRAPVIAMRTVAGGDVHALRDVPGAAWKDYLRERAGQVAPLFERSGAASWTELCMRFAHGLPGVVASVGSTSRKQRLDELLRTSRAPIAPLDPGIVAEIGDLQRRWADEVDAFGTPGSM